MPLDKTPLRIDEIDSLPAVLAATLRNLGESRTAYQAAIRIAERYGISVAVKVLNNIADNHPENAETVLEKCKNPYQITINKIGCQPGKLNFASRSGGGAKVLILDSEEKGIQ